MTETIFGVPARHIKTTPPAISSALHAPHRFLDGTTVGDRPCTRICRVNCNRLRTGR